MSNEVSIFAQQTEVSTTKRGPSKLAQTLSTGGITTRRIQTTTNGKFKRLINGEQIGNPVSGEINVIVIGALPSISRTFYKEKFDPNKEATLPNCWSNLGDRPDPNSTDPQGPTCATCPQNIKGSGDNGGRACRFQRRISVLVEGDKTGQIYQFNIPAKSLFGKGTGNVHPWESYVTFLRGNGESPDTVVTKIAFNDNAETMELEFTPLRSISDEEYDLVCTAQEDPDCDRYTKMTVAQADKVQRIPVIEAPAARPEEPEDDEPVAAAPVKRQTKEEKEPKVTPKADLSSVVSAWLDDEDA